MNKTIVILNGSPRPKGNTSVLIKFFSDTAKKQARQIKQFDLYPVKVIGCAHCDACKKFPNKPGCVLKDDFSKILDEIVSADVIAIASPVYCWSLSGCTKSALDRFYSIFNKGETSLISGKKVIGIMTAGGDHLDGMDLCIETLKRICNYSNSNYVGTFSAVNCTTPEELETRTELLEEANKLLKDT